MIRIIKVLFILIIFLICALVFMNAVDETVEVMQMVPHIMDIPPDSTVIYVENQ